MIPDALVVAIAGECAALSITTRKTDVNPVSIVVPRVLTPGSKRAELTAHYILLFIFGCQKGRVAEPTPEQTYDSLVSALWRLFREDNRIVILDRIRDRCQPFS